MLWKRIGQGFIASSVMLNHLSISLTSEWRKTLCISSSEEKGAFGRYYVKCYNISIVMKHFFKYSLLPATVFITGACVLIIEIVAVRALSPYFGNTIYTVSSVISVILIALSAGYYAGGKFADRRPSLKNFFGIIFLSGVLVIAIHFLSIILLPLMSTIFSLITGPLISSIILFLFPALLLGTLSPYAIKLQSLQTPEQGVGTISGKIFFWSTLGSITGSLFAGFVLIPRFGIDTIFITTGIVLSILGSVPILILRIYKKWVEKLGLFLFIFLAIASLFFETQNGGNILYSKDGVYEKIIIYEGIHKDRPIRGLLQDRNASSAMFLDTDDPTDMAYEYTKYYNLYKILKPDAKNILIIGGGAYSLAKALLAELPNATIDVAEIEPSLFELAKRYFKLKDSPNMNNFIEDGRRLLRDTQKHYDVIFSDVYLSLYSIPSHFTTKEFFALVKNKLTDGGIFIANIIGDLSRQQPSFVFTEMKTMKNVFPQNYFFAVDSPTQIEPQNLIFVGINGKKKIDFTDPKITQSNYPVIRSLQEKMIHPQRFEFSSYPILTDNYSPVEYLAAQVLKRAIREAPLLNGREMLAVIDQQLRYGPRYPGSPGYTKVQQFLIAEMQSLADEVLVQSWNQPLPYAQNASFKNIIARFFPNLNRRMILATHYDSKRFAEKDRKNPTHPVPGANDSASGVAVLVELGRALRHSKKTPEMGIDIVFFDGEESVLDAGLNDGGWVPIGSTYFAEHLNEIYQDDPPVFAVVVDMVCDRDLQIYKERSSIQHAQEYVDAFWSTAQKIDKRIFINEVRYNIIDDHTPLNQVGIPSFLIIDFDYKPHHATDDTLDKCSAESLETVGYALFQYLIQ